MNADIIKAMSNKGKTNKVKEWWRSNGYKVLRVVLFPIYLAQLAKDKYNRKANAAQVWDEKRSAEILSYYIPRDADWSEKDQCFYFFDNGMGWGHNTKKINRKDRRYWKVNCGWWGGEMRTYLMESFELEGFTKEIGNCYDGWTEITFYLNNKSIDKSLNF